MTISWPSMILPPINLYTVPSLDNRNKRMDNQRQKILFVCAQGRLRSATAMHLMNRLYGYNTRACGIDDDALVPLNPQLMCWADEVVVMEGYMMQHVQELADSHCAFIKIKNLSIPDEYDYMDEELCALIQRRFFS